MSYEIFAAHLYGVCVDGTEVRNELLYQYDGDHVYLFNDLMGGEYPEGFPEKAEGIDIFGGPGNDWYIGYKAIPPYAIRRKSQEDMDKAIYACLDFLLGKENVAKYYTGAYKPQMIFDTWGE